MALLNYTTTVEADKTVAEIQKMLVQAGASSLTSHFDSERRIASVSFTIETAYGVIRYLLPANVDGVLGVMERQKAAGKIKRAVNRDQARRAAWRIVKDWVEANLALIESEQVTLPQLMMPYEEAAPGVSLYLSMVDQRRALMEKNP